MNTNDTLLKASHGVAGVINKFLICALAILSLSMLNIPKAEAAICTADGSGNWTCAKQERDNWYWCGIVPWPRHVRWQVPEGTAPAGGWRTAFYYQGTTPTGTNSFSGPTKWRIRNEVPERHPVIF